jgi:hypothetical protein
MSVRWRAGLGMVMWDDHLISREKVYRVELWSLK